MKFEIMLNSEQTNILIDALSQADSEGCEGPYVILKCEIDKSKKYKVEQMHVNGECTTEYSSGNLL